MSLPNDHSFRKLLPGFVISAGTQVVLKVARPLSGGQQFKPPGSVGVVLESPPDNHRPLPHPLRRRREVEALVVSLAGQEDQREDYGNFQGN